MKFRFNRSLYLVTQREGFSMDDFINIIRQAIEGGVEIVQLREKKASFQEMCEVGSALQSLLIQRNIPLIINDRVDVALEIGAAGVHLGQSDFPVREARGILGKEALIGLSIETVDQLMEAQHFDIDYVAASPVFSTQTKNDCSPAWGLEGLKKICSLSRHPVIAIGGINEENIEEVIKCGAAGVALVSAIFNAPSPKKAAEILANKMRKYAN